MKENFHLTFIKHNCCSNHHVVGDLEALVLVQVVLKLDGLPLLVGRLVPPLLPLVRHPQPELYYLGRRRLHGHVAVHDLQLEAGVLGEELVVQKRLDRGPLLLVQLDAAVNDALDLGVLQLLEALRADTLPLSRQA